MAFPLIPVAITALASGGAGVAGTAYYTDAVEKTGEAFKAGAEPAKAGSKAVMALSVCVAICALCYTGLKIAGKG